MSVVRKQLSVVVVVVAIIVVDCMLSILVI